MITRPQVMRIYEIKKMMEHGLFYLPSFQRQYVWEDEDIKELIISILEGIPIGTIILWKPSVQSPKELDPFSEPLTGKKTISRDFYYIIDGQQRLTSLWLLFNKWRIEERGIERGPFSYVFEGGGKRVVKTKKIQRGIPLITLIKGFVEMDYNALEELKIYLPDETIWKEVKEKINGLFNYEMPVYIITTSKESEETFQRMAETFVKINRLGVRIGGVELMISYLAGAIKEKGWKERIFSLLKEVENYGIKFETLVRFIFSNFNLRQSQITKVAEFKRNTEYIKRNNNIDNILVRSEKAFRLAIKFLKEKLKIISASLLPSQMPIIPIAIYFYEREFIDLSELSHKEIEDITTWFILANFNGYYTSSPDVKLDRDLEVIRSQNEFLLDELLENMKEAKTRIRLRKEDILKGKERDIFRAQGKAYLFLLYMLLIKNQADDWTGRTIEGSKWNELAKHHIFPREFLLKNKIIDEGDENAEILMNNLGNITLINSEKNEEIGSEDPYNYIGKEEKVEKRQAERHFIPCEEEPLKDYETFLIQRVELIYNAARTYFPALFE